MAFDSVTNSTSNAKDFHKKKRGNRSAKLKQCKFDARRQQWLSQVKDKGNKEEANVDGEIHAPPVPSRNERDRAIGSLDVSHTEHDGLIHNYSDSDSSSNSPISHTGSVVGGNCSGTNFTGSGSSSRSSNSSRSCGFYSGNISEEDEDGCLDDWEAVADALAAADNKQEQHISNRESPLEHESITQSNSPPESAFHPAMGVGISRTKQENSRAWSPDDVFRPQSLPNLSKQYSFPTNLDFHGGNIGTPWACKVVAPSSCPICCEDLDFTDSSFLPCSCGFRLCLFCHKRILEEDGRCPGCRKQYECNTVNGEGNANSGRGSPTFCLARSCSMFARS